VIRFHSATAIAALAVGLGLVAVGTGAVHAADAAAPTVADTSVVPVGTPVGVRAGEHANFSRLVVDWTVPVGYTVDQADGEVRIRFDRAADLAVARIAARPPAGVSAIAVTRDAAGLPTLGFAMDGRIRHFRDGTRIVVDAMRPSNSAAAKPAKPSEQRAEVLPPAPAAAAVAATPVPRPAKPEPRAAAAATSPPLSLVPPAASEAAHPANDKAAHGAAAAIVAPAAAAATHGPSPSPVTGPQPVAAAPATAAGTAPAGAAARAATPTAAVPTAAMPTAPAVAGTAPPPTRAADPHAEPQRVVGAPVDVEVETDKDGVRMSFAFDAPVAAAAFRRGGHLWLVFDAAARIDIDGLSGSAGPLIRRVEQIGHRDATVLRIETEPGYNPSIASDGNKWNVFLAPQTLKPDAPLAVNLPSSRDAALSITTATAGSTLALQDPEIGDVFFVVPVVESAHGVETTHDFVDFRLLPSVQGVAVTAFSDRVDVRGRADGVSVAAIGGLRLTTPADRARLLEVAAVEGPPDAFFDFRGWQRADEGDFSTVRKALVERLLGARPDDRNLARLDLARFYFSYGLADRAGGVLAQIAREAPESERSPAFRALRGAAALLLGNTEAAKVDLDDRGLDPEAEIEVWRAAVLAEQGDLTGAAFGFQQAERFVTAYPEALRARFGLTGAWAALAIDDIQMAEFWHEFLKAMPLTGSQTERRRLIEGEIAAANGESEAALALFDSLIGGRDRFSRARAALDRVELMLHDERVTPAEAAGQLDRLRYVWRGDELEFEVLRRLGELQIAALDYRDGLLTLKRAVSNFADEPFAPEVTEEMRATFRRLYFDGDADALPAITAIGLFNEFRELAPAGEEGDEMIRRLANRMIAVDLLDKAGELLAHQVEFRLKGEEKARIGARLAIVRLLDRKPEAALAALDNSRVADLPVDLARERQMIGARAWAEQGDKARALALIAENRSEDADRLRAEIQWRARDWAGAADALERLAGPAPVVGEPLSELRARYALNTAVALALAGDQRRLSQVRRAYGPAMEGTPLAADFRIVAAADRTARDFDDVLQRIATVDDFDAFMKNYRARLLPPQKVSAAQKTDAPG
jgi:hypothetical protein